MKESPRVEVPLVAARAWLAQGLACLTTSREFDPVPGSSWREAGQRLLELLAAEGFPEPAALAFAGQCHGAQVREVTSSAKGIILVPECDGLVCACEGVLMAARTADCLPIALADPQAKVGAVLHAGWRGSLANILARGVEAMCALGAAPCRLRGWIGPSIGGARYEVSPELIEEFQAAHGHLGAFCEGRLLDLQRLNVLQSVAAGMAPGALADCRLCTERDASLFHSHRRQGRQRGQQFTVCGFLA